MQTKIDNAVALLQEVIREHKPTNVFGLFSGGHDSLSSTFVTSHLPEFTAAVHINTGIGIARTRQFVHDTCQEECWKLIELKASENTNTKGASDPQNYRDFVLKYGFPGPAGHGMMYVRLKERALQRLARMFNASARGKEKRRILLVAGCRSQESKRRMGNTQIVQVRGRFIWVNPIHDWNKCDTSDLIEFAGLKRNPIVDLIHKSGECLCGAFAKPDELEELKLWPDTREAYDRIKSLELEAAAAGKHCVWGTRPPRCERSTAKPGVLCWSCGKA
jgi:3'-phosphoadenosine 5'-phosphosulfate sulfotransferase (PAPS reductase)/FAD synthetase